MHFLARKFSRCSLIQKHNTDPNYDQKLPPEPGKLAVLKLHFTLSRLGLAAYNSDYSTQGIHVWSSSVCKFAQVSLVLNEYHNSGNFHCHVIFVAFQKNNTN